MLRDWIARLEEVAHALLRHWPILLITAVAAVLIFANLDRDFLWEDEGDTAVLARGILKEGVPVAWDGVNLAVPDFGQRLTRGLVMVSHPWLQYYLTAASFALFGQTVFAARLPFALAGLATIILVYVIALRLLKSRRVAVSAAILLLLSVQFLLFSRQARNYSLHALMVCLLLLQFHRLNSWKNAVLFAVLGILLFHTHPIGLAAIAMLGMLTLVYRPFRSFRVWFWGAAAVVGIYAAPWLVVSQRGYAENTTVLQDFSHFAPRLLQFLIEWGSVAPLIGLLILYVVVRIRQKSPQVAGNRRNIRHPPTGIWTDEEKSFALELGAISLGYAFVMALTQSRDVIWIVGVRYASAVIPFTMLAAGMLIVKASRSNRTVWVLLLLLFGFTKVGRLTPYVFWAEPVALRDSEDLVGFHVPSRLKDRFARTGQIRYIEALVRPSPGVIERIASFLNANAAPEDIVITNYAWEAVYFHTNLPQGMKLLPSTRISEAARKHGLPGYIFSPQGVRWIVWRRAWAPLWGQDCQKIVQDLIAAGIPVHQVALIPETLYENRENLHFRRFAGKYIFPWFDNLPDVVIYRVDWPDIATDARRSPG